MAFLADYQASSKWALVIKGTVSNLSNSSFLSGFYSTYLYNKISASIDYLIAPFAAFWHNSQISAPLNPSAMFAKNFKSTSGATGDFLKFALNISYLESLSGKGI